MCCFIGGLGGLWRMLRRREDHVKRPPIDIYIHLSHNTHTHYIRTSNTYFLID